jgi:hypothetical protein
VNHPGWEDDRHTYNGLFDYADDWGNREAFEPLANELARQQRFAESIFAGEPFVDRRETDVSALDWAAHAMQARTDESRPAEAAAL